jgi:hypothetical protein
LGVFHNPSVQLLYLNGVSTHGIFDELSWSGNSHWSSNGDNSLKDNSGNDGELHVDTW